MMDDLRDLIRYWCLRTEFECMQVKRERDWKTKRRLWVRRLVLDAMGDGMAI